MSPEKYWDDAREGEECVSPTYTVTKERILAYADLTGDHTPVHVDEAYANASHFGCIVDVHRRVVAREIGVGEDAFLGDGVGGTDALVALLRVVPVLFRAHSVSLVAAVLLRQGRAD